MGQLKLQFCPLWLVEEEGDRQTGSRQGRALSRVLGLLSGTAEPPLRVATGGHSEKGGRGAPSRSFPASPVAASARARGSGRPQ